MRTVEQAMGEDLVRLAERCDKLEAEVSVERHNLAISEHQRRELEAELASMCEEANAAEAENARLKESLRTWAPLNEAKAEVARLASLERLHLQWRQGALKEIEELRAALDEKKSLAADRRALGC